VRVQFKCLLLVCKYREKREKGKEEVDNNNKCRRESEKAKDEIEYKKDWILRFRV